MLTSFFRAKSLWHLAVTGEQITNFCGLMEPSKFPMGTRLTGKLKFKVHAPLKNLS